MRLAFAGTPEFARVALERLLDAGFDLALVLSQPDRPSGRGMKLQPSPVKALALERGLSVLQPQGLRLDGRFSQDAAAARAALQAARIDAVVVAAYGLILPDWLLELPPLGCLNIHASLLPRWRGAAPIHRAIEAGDTATGVTIMQMDSGLDTGDMLLAESEPIAASDSTASLHDRLAALGGRMVVEALGLAARDALVRAPQPHEGVSYAHKIGKAEAPIDWSQPAAVIERRLRAFDPFPGASFGLDGETVKLWRALPNEGSGAPGTVLEADERLVVACGDAALALQQLQRPGGRRVSAREFLAAKPALRPGLRLAAGPDAGH
ncbi:MAG: methionyl-tRNA formyltransferase [Methylibium sp.]|nr:methionyl-tRNA formyltransferase [Methylibium sp.]